MKIAIIGAGNVGTTAAQRIAEAGLADVVLLDIVEGKARALALDLSSASSIVGHSRCITGTTDYKDIAGAGIVIITAGQTRKPQQSREDLLLNNGRVVKEVSQKITRYCANAIVIVVTNPVDVMTYLSLKTTGFPSKRIIGMGGVCDCARFNMLLAAELNVAAKDIQSVIIGAHADSMVILPGLATVKGVAISESLSEEKIKEAIAQTRGFGANIVKLLGKGSAYYGPSAAIFLLVDAIINDRKSILCNSAYLSGQYGVLDLCIGVATRIGKTGIEEIIELKLTQEEKEAFLASAKGIEKLKKILRN
jgi:malate dehydrogenase